MLVTPYFTATLINKLDKLDVQLSLSQADNARLLAAIGDGNYTYLTIRDSTAAEIVKAEVTCDTILITRAQDGTVATTFPKGSCVRFEMTPAVVKDLICNYDCCDGPCPCTAVTSAGVSFPPATSGQPWTGNAIFSGTLPIELTSTGAPSWVTVTVGTNYLTFSGTPTGAGTFNIAIAATNCSGEVAVANATLTVT